MKPYRGFADLIRSQRKELGFTLIQVAEKTGWSIPYVSELERGVKQPPPSENLRPLAAALNLSYPTLVREAELSRRSIELDLEGVTKKGRYVALLLARRFQEGFDDEEAQEILDVLGRYGGLDDEDESA